MGFDQEGFHVHGAESHLESVMRSGDTASFRAGDCLLGMIKQGFESGCAWSIEVEGSGVVHADFKKGIYQASVRSEANFFGVNPRYATVAPFRHGVERGGRPVEELLWKAAFYGSFGRLLEGCNLFDVVELQRWPNFTRLPHSVCCLPLCSLLARRPSSIAFAHRMLRVPPGDAMRFYSAARSAGYLRVISAQPDASGPSAMLDTEEDPSGSSFSGFWTRLFGRVVGL